MTAEIRTRKRDGVPVLVVYWRDSRGKRHTVYGDATKKLFGPDTPEARSRAEAFRGEVERETPSTAHGLTLLAWTKKWLEQIEGFVAIKQMSEPTLEHYERVLRLTVISHWIAKRPLAQLSRGDVKEWATKLTLPKAKGGHGYGVATAGNAVRVLGTCLKTAIDDEVIPGPNVAARLMRPMKLVIEDSTVHPPTVEVTAALLGAVAERSKGAFVVLAMLGLRIGEALGLKWTDINFEKQEARIERQVHQVHGKGKLAKPKSAAGKRIVEIPGPAIEMLRAVKARQGADALARGHKPTVWVLGYEPERSLAARQLIREDWRKAAKAIGYEGRVWLHGVRHTYGMGRVEIGGEKTLITLKNAMGHSRIGITFDLYAKHAQPRDQGNADQFAARMTGSLVLFPQPEAQEG